MCIVGPLEYGPPEIITYINNMVSVGLKILSGKYYSYPALVWRTYVD